ncbi:GATA zinc finger domain-containing protein 14-like [Microplitis mediator]|uniref:GATA zinc finger domain-containing protein 14-like n=1 Tax=Microplitis mediator TaxID=375433 RepID=UPI00255247CB|nr:GATA zinc finger domain-containing protein 14-like [Microplitis mediator]
MKLTVLVILITQVHLFSCQKSRSVWNTEDYYQNRERFEKQELPIRRQYYNPDQGYQEGPSVVNRPCIDIPHPDNTDVYTADYDACEGKDFRTCGMHTYPGQYSRRAKVNPSPGSRSIPRSKYTRNLSTNDPSSAEQIIIVAPSRHHRRPSRPIVKNYNSAVDSRNNIDIERVPSDINDDVIVEENDPELIESEGRVQSAPLRWNAQKSKNKNLNVNSNTKGRRQYDPQSGYYPVRQYPPSSQPSEYPNYPPNPQYPQNPREVPPSYSQGYDYPYDQPGQPDPRDVIPVLEVPQSSRNTRRRVSENKNTNVNTNVNTNNEARRRSLNDNKNVNVNVNKANAENADDETATNDVEAGNADADNLVEANDDTTYYESVISPVSVTSRRYQAAKTDDSNGKSRRGSRRSKNLDPSSASRVQSRRNTKSLGSDSRRKSETENSGKRRNIVTVGDSTAANGVDASNNQIRGSRGMRPTVVVTARRLLRNRDDNKNININNNVNNAAIDDDIKVDSRRLLTSSAFIDDNDANGVSYLPQLPLRHRGRNINENKNVNINVNRFDSSENA